MTLTFKSKFLLAEVDYDVMQTLLPVQIKRLAIDDKYIISIDIDENLTNEQIAQIQAGVVEYVKNNLITRVL